MYVFFEVFYCLFSWFSCIFGSLLQHASANVFHDMAMLIVGAKPPLENDQLSLQEAESNSSNMPASSNEQPHIGGLNNERASSTGQGHVPLGRVSDIRPDRSFKSHVVAKGRNRAREPIRNSWNGYEAHRARAGNSQEARSATTSLRLNRFERPRRDNHALSVYNMRGSVVSATPSDELKFRTEFQSCFRQFPLEKVFRRSWESHESPLEIFAGKASSKELETLTLLYDDLEALFLAPDAKQIPTSIETLSTEATSPTCDSHLPVNPDGSPIAELDAVSTTWSSLRAEEIATANREAVANETRQDSQQISPPSRTTRRFKKRLSTLRPSSWAARASIRLNLSRKLPEPDQSIVESPISRCHSPQKPCAPWKIEATEQGILLCHSALPQHDFPHDGSLQLNQGADTVKSDDFVWLDKDCAVDTETVEELSRMATIGGCCVSIATQAQ